jgi:hypothetical protein
MLLEKEVMVGTMLAQPLFEPPCAVADRTPRTPRRRFVILDDVASRVETRTGQESNEARSQKKKPPRKEPPDKKRPPVEPPRKRDPDKRPPLEDPPPRRPPMKEPPGDDEDPGDKRGPIRVD